MRIENVLKENGYQKVSGANIFSSAIAGGVWHNYKKEKNLVTIGLGTAGYPPTLLHPTPHPFDSASTIGWIDKSTDEQIIEFIENNQ